MGCGGDWGQVWKIGSVKRLRARVSAGFTTTDLTPLGFRYDREMNRVHSRTDIVYDPVSQRPTGIYARRGRTTTRCRNRVSPRRARCAIRPGRLPFLSWLPDLCPPLESVPAGGKMGGNLGEIRRPPRGAHGWSA